MKHNYKRLVLTFMVIMYFTTWVSAQQDTLLIDFGSNLSLAPANNITSGKGSDTLLNLMNYKHQITPIDIFVYDAFNGINTGGSSTPDAALKLPGTATADSYFGNTSTFGGKIEPTGAFQLAGLNPDKTYRFEIFASRMGVSDNREAKYRFIGITKDSVNLNASANASNSVSLSMQPKADGTINVEVSPGPNNNNSSGFYYLGSVKMIYDDASAVLPAELSLVSPNGGEDWMGGTSQIISWEGINLSGKTILSYSVDNGTNWTQIAELDSAARNYFWTIPQENSANCLVKVASSSITDQSDAVFTMTPAPPVVYDTLLIDFGSSISKAPANNVTSGNGADSLYHLMNNRYRVTPFDLLIYDAFNGINTGGTTTPDPALRLPATATSDSYFGNTVTFSGKIEASGAMQITGLNPEVTYSFEIFASRMGVSDNREAKYRFIGLTKDSVNLNASANASNSVGLAMKPKADGTINIEVSPGPNNNNSSGFYYLGSIKMIYEDPTAELPAELSLTAPNGGEELLGGTPVFISWDAMNLWGKTTLSYSVDNGTSWTEIVELDSIARNYSWNVPQENSVNCLMRVMSTDLSDVSDAVFSITATEVVVYDTIGIDFGAAAKMSGGHWNNLSNTFGDGEIEHLLNSRSLLTPIGVNIYDRFTGANTDGTPSPDISLRIPSEAASDSYYGSVKEWASTIQPTGAMTFTGLIPDKEYTITIFASRMSVSDNRETKYIFTGAAKDSVYLNPANNISTVAKITVKADVTGAIDLLAKPGENNTNSNGFYYLGALKMIYEIEDVLPASIAVISPNGGESFIGGTVQTIAWNAINIDADVTLAYSADNGATWTDIETVDQSVSTYDWTLPASASTTSLIRVTAGELTDVSDNAFTIIDATAPMLSLVSPMEGEYWIIGDQRNIRWFAANLTADITVEFSNNNGTSWTTIGTADKAAQSLDWEVDGTVSDECKVKLTSGSLTAESAATFSLVEGVCNSTIVILGSSTAYGSGANPISDSSWVNRFKAELLGIDSSFSVINLALGGYNSFKILPDNYPIPSQFSETIDATRNVTKALTYNPYAIIINMPSNDAVNYYGLETQIANFSAVINEANAAGVKTWIATTQPRNFTDPVQVQIQTDVRDEIFSIWGEHAIDFWSDVADENGMIKTEYNSGDGIHLNNAGHRLLFQRVSEKMIDSYACFEEIPDPDPVLSISSASIKIYPNPYIQQVNIDFKTYSEGKIEATFYDLSGKVNQVISKEVNGAGAHTEAFTPPNHAGTQILILKITDSRGVSQKLFKLIPKN